MARPRGRGRGHGRGRARGRARSRGKLRKGRQSVDSVEMDLDLEINGSADGKVGGSDVATNGAIEVLELGLAAAPAAGQNGLTDTSSSVPLDAAPMDIYTLPDGTKLPRGKWAPLTQVVLRDSSEQKPAKDPERMDADMQKLYDAAVAGGHTFNESTLQFLARDLQQALSANISSKKAQSMLLEDLGTRIEDIENYDAIRTEWPSEEEMSAMAPGELVELFNRVQEDFPDMLRERTEAEARCEEAEAKAKRDMANLDKQKREHEERLARKRGELVRDEKNGARADDDGTARGDRHAREGDARNGGHAGIATYSDDVAQDEKNEPPKKRQKRQEGWSVAEEGPANVVHGGEMDDVQMEDAAASDQRDQERMVMVESAQPAASRMDVDSSPHDAQR